jgi:RNA polymerase sigma factor (sigma-70 family)
MKCTERRLTAYARRISPVREDVADLIAETWDRTWAARQRVFADPDPSEAVIGFMRAAGHDWVAADRAAQRLRRDLAAFNDEKVLASDDDSISVELAIARRAWARRVLRHLSEEQHAAVWLRVCRGLSYDVIAQRLRLNTEAVRARVHRGLVRLRRVITRDPFPVEGG